MSYLKVKEINEKMVHLYPLSCFHIGARQSDRMFIEQHIERIRKDKYARWVYMGDGGECVTRLSKGNIFRQVYPPQTQMEILVKLLKPIRDKGLLCIRGNHGGRIFKETGMSFDKNLALVLGLPYMGVEAFFQLICIIVPTGTPVVGEDALHNFDNKPPPETRSICAEQTFSFVHHFLTDLFQNIYNDFKPTIKAVELLVKKHATIHAVPQTISVTLIAGHFNPPLRERQTPLWKGNVHQPCAAHPNAIFDISAP